MSYSLTSEFHEAWVRTMGIIALTCFTIGFPLNIISLSYFLRQKYKPTCNVLYIIVNSVDIIIGKYKTMVIVSYLNEICIVVNMGC